MKKITLLFALCSLGFVLAGCAKQCAVEPIVEQNQKLIVPPNFGNMPKCFDSFDGKRCIMVKSIYTHNA